VPLGLDFRREVSRFLLSPFSGNCLK